MEELLQNIKTFWKSAEMVYGTRDYTSATILYFKCLFGVLDLMILRNKKFTPKDHAERFRILESDFPEQYLALDKLFAIYRDTYSIKIEKEKCDEVREYVIAIAKEQKIQFNNK